MADNNNDIDILLRYLAKRASPDSKEPRINFKKFADAAQTREQADFKSIEEGGERLFGPRASAKRKHYRELYNNYVKKVDYGTDILDVPSDWSIDLYLEITPELRRVLSTKYIPPRRTTSRSISPKRTTTNSHSRRLESSLSPPRVTANSTTTMSKSPTDEEINKIHTERWHNARSYNTTTAIDFSGGINSKGVIAWEEQQVEVETGPPAVYATKGNIAFTTSTPEAAAASKPRIINGGRSITALRPSHDPLLFHTFKSGKSILGPSFQAKQGPNTKRDTCLDVQLGSLMNSQDADYIEVDGNDVPFREEEFLLPNGVIASNGRFNGSTTVDSSDLQIKVVPISNLHMKNPEEIILDIKESLDKMQEDGIGNIQVHIDEAKKKLLDTVNSTMIGYIVHLRFEIVGEAWGGFGNKKDKTNLADLMSSSWGISE